jgi:hypothetical protein
MKKKNDLFPLLLAMIYGITIASGCGTGNDPKQDEIKIERHGEEYVQRVNSGDIKEDDYEGSVYRINSTIIDSLRIKILYGSPGVRKRVIWGNVVPYDTVWVSGAIKATAIDFSKDVTIGGKKLRPGKYAFFTIPGRKSWKIIINTDYHQHNTNDYDTKKDLLRLDVVPDTLSQPTERLTYSIKKGAKNDVKITLSWEKLSIPFNVKMNQHSASVAL